MNSRLNYIYANMKNRCYNEKNIHYQNYGGRGITVCDELNLNYKTVSTRLRSGWSIEKALGTIPRNKQRNS